MNKITVPAVREELQRVFDYTEEALQGMGCPPKVIMKYLIALDEMLTNVVSYSGAEEMSVAIARQGDIFKVELSDDGKAFNPLEKKDPDTSLSAEERQIGGLGIFMVKKSMDRMSYAYIDGRNVITLEHGIG